MEQQQIYQVPNNLPKWQLPKEINSVKDMLIQSYTKYNDRIFIHQLENKNNISKDKIQLTFNHFGQRVIHLAQKLSKLQDNIRVCLFSENKIECFEIIQACALAGIIIIPLYDSLNDEDLKYIKQDSEFNCLFISKNKLQKCQHIIDDNIKTIILDDMYYETNKQQEQDYQNAQFTSYKNLFEDFKLQNEPIAKLIEKTNLKQTDKFTEVAIIYTSGTTSNPKGCVLSDNNVLFTVYSWIQNVDYPVNNNKEFHHRNLFILPLAHVYSFLMQFKDVWSGNELFIASNIKNIKQELLISKPTYLIVVPRVIEKLFDSIDQQLKQNKLISYLYHKSLQSRIDQYNTFKQQQNEQDFQYLTPRFKFKSYTNLIINLILKQVGLENLVYTVTGGSSCSAQMSAKFICFVNSYFLQGSGMSETCSYFSKQRPWKLTVGSVGSIMDGESQYQLIQSEEFEKIYSNFLEKKGENIKIGELLIKSQSLMVRYQNQTSQYLDQNGYFHTGDLVAYDTQNEEFYILQRLGQKSVKLSCGKFVRVECIQPIIQQTINIIQNFDFENQAQNDQKHDQNNKIIEQMQKDTKIIELNQIMKKLKLQCQNVCIYSQSQFNSYLLILSYNDEWINNKNIDQSNRIIDYISQDQYKQLLYYFRQYLQQSGFKGYQLPSGIVFITLQDKFLTPTQKVKQVLIRNEYHDLCQQFLILLQDADKSNIDQLSQLGYNFLITNQ